MSEVSWLIAMVASSLYWAYSGSRWAALLAIFCYLVCTGGKRR